MIDERALSVFYPGTLLNIKQARNSCFATIPQGWKTSGCTLPPSLWLWPLFLHAFKCLCVREPQTIQKIPRVSGETCAHLSLLLVMLTSFSMPPVSAKALAFSMFLLVTSCRVQQMAATVSSDSRVVFPPGRRFTRSLMAYFPAGGEMQHSDILHCCFLGSSSSREISG